LNLRRTRFDEIFRAKVQLLCKDSIASEVSHNIDTGEKLSQLATSFFDEAESLRSSANDKNWTSENQVMWLVHDALYYQCKISIHSMVVPVFSGIKDDPKIDLATQRKGAAAVAKHASIFRLLLEPYFSGQRHASFVPSLVGYGAFVVGIVLLVIDRSCASGTMNGFPTEMSESRSRLSSVTSILHLLDRLRVYSRALQRPVSSVCPAYKLSYFDGLKVGDIEFRVANALTKVFTTTWFSTSYPWST
jgi:hypothetical protein